MIEQQEMDHYKNCMEEIKRRHLACKNILTGVNTTSFDYTNAEFAALQVRKILELIVLASVASNKGIMGELFEKATDTWRIRRILDMVKNVNSDFYPRPVINEPTQDGDAKIKWVSREDDWLKEDELITAYDELGMFLHATSPYHPSHEIERMRQHSRDISAKVVALLNQHVVQMPGNTYLLNVQMNASANGRDPNGHVACSIFEKVQ